MPLKRTGTEQDSAGNQTLLICDPKLSWSFMVSNSMHSLEIPQRLPRASVQGLQGAFVMQEVPLLHGRDRPEDVNSFCSPKSRAKRTKRQTFSYISWPAPAYAFGIPHIPSILPTASDNRFMQLFYNQYGQKFRELCIFLLKVKSLCKSIT